MGYVHAKRPGAVDIANQAADAKAATTKAAAAKQMAGTGYAEQAAALAPEQAVQAKAAAGAKGAKGAKPKGGVTKVVSGTDAALGYQGPLGPYGPLGTLGPIGKNAWNASEAMRGAGDWTKQREQQTKAGGPMSERGPLGPAGPVGEVDQRGAAVAPALRPGASSGALGAVGPLGALGPLGPLGPVGAHGYQADAEGNYRDAKGQIVRSVDIPYEGGQRSYDLVENYTEEQAKGMEDNDVSFMVSGKADAKAERDVYAFTAKHGQMVTVCLIPEKQLDDFDMTIRDASGKVLFDSTGSKLVDNVQLTVKPGTQLQAEVRLKQSLHVLESTYRLVVTGSSEYVKV